MPAYRAVAAPVEGTILSVARGAALAATATGTDNLADVARAAAAGAAEALARTPEQLAALARAGVVDAGGRGLVVLLDALVEVITGEASQRQPPRRGARTPPGRTGPRVRLGGVRVRGPVPPRRSRRRPSPSSSRPCPALGDSLAVVGIGLMTEAATHPTWNVHVHVNDVGAALEAAVQAGRPHRISVTHFADPDRERQELEPAAIMPTSDKVESPHAPTRHRGGRRR